MPSFTSLHRNSVLEKGPLTPRLSIMHYKNWRQDHLLRPYQSCNLIIKKLAGYLEVTAQLFQVHVSCHADWIFCSASLQQSTKRSTTRSLVRRLQVKVARSGSEWTTGGAVTDFKVGLCEEFHSWVPRTCVGLTDGTHWVEFSADAVKQIYPKIELTNVPWPMLHPFTKFVENDLCSF